MKTERFPPSAPISEKLSESATTVMRAADRHMSSLDPVFVVRNAKAAAERPIDST